MAEKVRVLSIDGGGIRGVIPTMVLDKIETLTDKPISQLFDLIAGTSTGAIIGMAMAVPDEDGRPRWSAHEYSRYYVERGSTIFPRSRKHLLRAAEGLLEEKYEAHGVEKVASELFGERTLAEGLTEVLVSGYSLEQRKPIFFKSSKAKQKPDYDLPMRVIARAATAAPTYFAPSRIDVGDTGDYLAVVDGGVFANNPAMSAYVDARRLWPDAEISVLSLGTGELTARIPYEEAKHWGAARWARPLLQITLDGSNHAIDYQLKHLLGADNYLRLQPMLTQGSQMDDPGEDNLRILRLTAQRALEKHKAVIAKLCEELMS